MAKSATRNANLRHLLVEHRQSTLDGIRMGIRDRRSESAEVRDEYEQADADANGDVSVALLQLRADTLTRIDQALARLAMGLYGACSDCHGDIATPRLRALPFAERCQACQARREQVVRATPRQQLATQGAERLIAARYDGWTR